MGYSFLLLLYLNLSSISVFFKKITIKIDLLYQANFKIGPFWAVI